MRWTYLIENYRKVANYAGTALFAWILAGIVAQAIASLLPLTAESALSAGASEEAESLTDAPAPTSDVAYYMPICERNIFDSEHRSPCSEEVTEETEEQVDLSAEPVKSDLAVTLLGTIVFSNPALSRAAIGSKSGKPETQTYYIDDMILGEAKIYQIIRNKVFFTRGGRREFIEVENLPAIYTPSTIGAEGGSGEVKVAGDKATVSRAKVEATLGDLNQVIQQARMVPNYQDGVVTGFKVFAIKPGSIFSELGLQNGDVIHRINGTDIDSVEKALPMLQLARNESSITIDYTRKGTRKTLSIDIR